MRKTFTIENAEYTVTTCTAVAYCDLPTGNTQDALLVVNITDTDDHGELIQKVVFGYEMPETVEDFEAMCDDSSAWESDSEVLDTVTTIWYAVMTDNDDYDWGSGSYNLDEADERVNNLREQGYTEAYIAVIRENSDPICIEEIR